MREHLDAKKLMIPWSNQLFFQILLDQTRYFNIKSPSYLEARDSVKSMCYWHCIQKIVQRKRTPQVGAPSFLCGVTVHLARMGFRHVEEVTSWRWYVKPCTWIGTVKTTTESCDVKIHGRSLPVLQIPLPPKASACPRWPDSARADIPT